MSFMSAVEKRQYAVMFRMEMECGDPQMRVKHGSTSDFPIPGIFHESVFIRTMQILYMQRHWDTYSDRMKCEASIAAKMAEKTGSVFFLLTAMPAPLTLF